MFVKIIKQILCLLFFLSNASNAYVLRNNFYILNLSKSTVEVNYNTCYHNVIDGKSSTTCEDNVVIIKPKQAKQFSVDNSDNYYKDTRNHFSREIYVYQVVSRNALGLFLKDENDYYLFKKDYEKVAVKGHVLGCIASYKASVILNDYGTDKIYCLYERTL